MRIGRKASPHGLCRELVPNSAKLPSLALLVLKNLKKLASPLSRYSIQYNNDLHVLFANRWDNVSTHIQQSKVGPRYNNSLQWHSLAHLLLVFYDNRLHLLLSRQDLAEVVYNVRHPRHLIQTYDLSRYTEYDISKQYEINNESTNLLGPRLTTGHAVNS